LGKAYTYLRCLNSARSCLCSSWVETTETATATAVSATMTTMTSCPCCFWLAPPPSLDLLVASNPFFLWSCWLAAVAVVSLVATATATADDADDAEHNVGRDWLEAVAEATIKKLWVLSNDNCSLCECVPSARRDTGVWRKCRGGFQVYSSWHDLPMRILGE